MKRELSCYCGKSKKTFFNNVGDNYIGECCEEAGYDHLGNPPQKKEKKVQKEGPTRRYTPSGKYSKKKNQVSESDMPEGNIDSLIHKDDNGKS